MRPPVIVNTIMSSAIASDEILIRLSATALAIAQMAIISIAGRDPVREMTAPLRRAPSTPPRLKAVMPLLDTRAARPAPAKTVGSQLNTRYTARRHEQKAIQSAIVSRRNSASKSDEIGARVTVRSVASSNAASGGTE